MLADGARPHAAVSWPVGAGSDRRRRLGARRSSGSQLWLVASPSTPASPDGADFTGIIEARELLIHEVVQQAFIAVDEEGTEAAAATAVIIGLESAPTPVSVSIDRPFLFLIEHRATGELLFIGQVTDPS